MYRTVEEHESEVGAKLSKHSDVVTSCEEIVMVVHPGKGEEPFFFFLEGKHPLLVISL